MIVPSDSAAETARLAALAATGLLDAAPHPALERIAGLAARLFAAPIALISVIGRDRQRILARVGTGMAEIDRALSFCDHTIRSSRPMVVADLSRDPRFGANPLVTAPPGLRFYAGAPLAIADGHNIGTLCVLDTEPRRCFGAAGEWIMRDLAALVVDELALMRQAA